MSTPLNVNGVTYNYPASGDENWASDASAWASAITSGMLQKAGGTFTLTAEIDFGSSYGVKSLYFKSRGTTVASAGAMRLANTETLSWRNAGNTADVSLSVNASDAFLFTSALYVPDGTVSSPSLTFTAQANTGLYRPSGSEIGMTCGGVLAAQISNTSFNVYVPQENADGTAAAPTYSFNSESNSGFFRAGASQVAVSIVGTQTAIFASTGLSLTGSLTSNAVVVGSASHTISGLSTIVNTGTLTLPSTTSTLATLALSETFSNKTLDNSCLTTVKAANLTIQDGVDTTKQAKFVASSITTATTRSYTLPDVSDTLVTLSATQTLTNKTISGGSNTLSSIGDGSLSTSYLKADGTRALTGNWSAGAFSITANSVAVGSSANAITACNTLASATGLNLQTNGSTTAMSIDTTQNAIFSASIQLPTSGGTPTNLDYYEEGSFTANFSGGAGAAGTGTSFTVKFTRVGKVVTITFPNMTSMTSGSTPSAAFIAASTTVPTRLRPVANIYGTYLASLGATTTVGTWNIQVSGEIDLYRDLTTLSTNWATSTASQGAFAFTAVYTIA